MAIMKKLLILLLFIPYFGFSQGIKVSALTEATSVGSSDLFLLVQSGTTKKVQFYRFAYNSDSVASQVSDSLVNYLAKKDSSDYITITRLNDSLDYYSSILGLVDSLAKYTTKVMLNDSLTAYKWTEDSTARVVHDSLVNYGSPVSFGTDGQVAFMNVAGSDLSYSDNFKWNDTTLILKSELLNVFIGDSSGFNNIEGDGNTFVGINSGVNNEYGTSSSYIGYGAGYSNTLGYGNTFLGALSGYSNLDGNNNVYIGLTSGRYSLGNRNLFIGFRSGQNNLTGDSCVFIGNESGENETGSNKLYIENSNSTTPLIYGDFANDSVKINGTLYVTGDVIVKQELKHEIYEAAAYVPEDSTLTTSATTAWQFVGVGDNNKFVNIYAEGFVPDGDTLQWVQRVDDLRDSVEFNVSWSTSSSCSNNGITVYYGLNIKNDSEPTYTIYNPVTRSTRCATSGQAYSWACTTMPIFLKDGAKIQIVVKTSGSTTVTTEDFGIYLKEE